MEVYCTMKVNDKNTGELLGKTSQVFTCDECQDIEEFGEEHADEIEEYLQNSLHPDIFTGSYIMRVDMVELMEKFAGESVK